MTNNKCVQTIYAIVTSLRAHVIFDQSLNKNEGVIKDIRLKDTIDLRYRFTFLSNRYLIDFADVKKFCQGNNISTRNQTCHTGMFYANHHRQS